MRGLFVMFLASVPLHATSFASAICTVGTTTQSMSDPASANCSVPLTDSQTGEEVGSAVGYATITGSLYTGLTADAGGGFGPNGISSYSGPDVDGFGGGTASYDETLTTPGPPRPGFISVYFSVSYRGAAGASLTQNGIGYGAYAPFGPPVPEAFELGEPFQVSVFASEGGGGTFPCYVSCGGETSASILGIGITEADGITGVPYFSVVTPEPVTWVLLLFGLTACVVVQARARNADPKAGG